MSFGDPPQNGDSLQSRKKWASLKTRRALFRDLCQTGGAREEAEAPACWDGGLIGVPLAFLASLSDFPIRFFGGDSSRNLAIFCVLALLVFWPRHRTQQPWNEMIPGKYRQTMVSHGFKVVRDSDSATIHSITGHVSALANEGDLFDLSWEKWGCSGA